MAVEVEMNDEVFRELRAKIGAASHAFVKVGVLASAGGSETAAKSDITLAELLAIHEFGAPSVGIPARAPLRLTFTEPDGQQNMSKFLERTARLIIRESISVDKALEQLGAWAVAQVKKRVKARLDPPLRPATLKKKTVDGKVGDVPLIDTNQLINSITWEVKR